MGQQVASQPDLALEANDFTLIFLCVTFLDLINCAGPAVLGEGQGVGRGVLGDDGGRVRWWEHTHPLVCKYKINFMPRRAISECFCWVSDGLQSAARDRTNTEERRGQCRR